MSDGNYFGSVDKMLIMTLNFVDEEETTKKALDSKKNRQFSIQKTINTKSATHSGEYYRLFKYLTQDDRKFFQYFRMSYGKFQELLKLIEPHIKRKHAKFRGFISLEERLAITMRFLGHCGPFGMITFNYKLNERTVRNIIHTTCNAIWTCLSPIVMPSPNEESWIKIEKGFSKKWNYPNAIGALDGRYVVIEKSPNIQYINDSRFLLIALVDADDKFITVDIEKYVKNGNKTVFRDSQFGKKLLSNKLNVPSSKLIPNTNTFLPHVMVADEAFPLNTHIMRPFPEPQLLNNELNKIYNYRHNRALGVCKNAFGMLYKKFRIYTQKLQVSPKHLDTVVLSTICLHNFLKHDAKNLWQPNELDRYEVTRGLQELQGISGNSSFEAFDIRENFKHYFGSSTGRIRSAVKHDQ